MKTSTVLCGVVLAATSTMALAEDSAGWYFRGDIGVAMSNDANIEDKTPDPVGATSFPNLCDGNFFGPNNCAFDLDDVDDSVSWSIGAGYRFDDNFRMDLVGSYKPDFELDDSIPAAFNGGFGGGFDVHKADIDVTTLMVTGYYDFKLDGSSYKPYVGAGIGYSETDIGTTRVTNTTTGLDRTHGGDTESGMAWQLTAGLGIPIDNNKVLDISYKYVDAGDIDSGSSTVSGNAGGPFGPFPFNGVEGDMTYHEISVGLRF